MRYRMFGAMLLGLVSSATWGIQANAQVPGTSPVEIYNTLVSLLPQSGMTAMPPGYYEVPGFPSGRTTVLRGTTTVVGQLELHQNVETEEASLTVYDSQNHPIAWATQRIYDCRPGTGMSATFTTLHDRSEGFPPAFEVRFEPGVGTYYLRYGREAEPLFWQRDFQASIGWITQVMAQMPGVAIRSADPREAIFLVLATDPATAPLLPGLRIVSLRGRIHLIGTVPSTPAYNVLAMTLINHGFTAFDLDVTIGPR